MFKLKRGDIYLVNIKKQSGSVQSGKRYCVIIQNDKGNLYSKTTIIVPLTTRIKKVSQPTHVIIEDCDCLPYRSMALCEQILTVSENDLISYTGKVSDEDMRNITIALLYSLGIIM